jgi:uncharacterized membrane-anchored protein
MPKTIFGPRLRGIIALLAGLLILVAVNVSIAGKERLLAEGRVVYLQLLPVDPRSLMQGDYMALRFGVAEAAMAALPRTEGEQSWNSGFINRDGRIVVSLDDKGIASFVRLDDGQPLAGNEILMRYRVRNGQLKFATNAYFFQEGQSELYATTSYGQFRVDADGELLLTNLCDGELMVLGVGGT